MKVTNSLYENILFTIIKVFRLRYRRTKKTGLKLFGLVSPRGNFKIRRHYMDGRRDLIVNGWQMYIGITISLVCVYICISISPGCIYLYLNISRLYIIISISPRCILVSQYLQVVYLYINSCRLYKYHYLNISKMYVSQYL